jgi:hypothetical protein
MSTISKIDTWDREIRNSWVCNHKCFRHTAGRISFLFKAAIGLLVSITMFSRALVYRAIPGLISLNSISKLYAPISLGYARRELCYSFKILLTSLDSLYSAFSLKAKDWNDGYSSGQSLLKVMEIAVKLIVWPSLQN